MSDTRQQIIDILISEEFSPETTKLIKLYEQLIAEKESVIEEIALSKNRSWGGKGKKQKEEEPKIETIEQALNFKITFLKKEELNNKTIQEIYNLNKNTIKWLSENAYKKHIKTACKMVLEHFEKDQQPTKKIEIKTEKGIGIEKSNELTLFFRNRFGDNYQKEIDSWLKRFNKKELENITENQALVIKEKYKKSA